MAMNPSDKALAGLETFRIEIPSWGFANTGTRFGKFLQAAAATLPKRNSAMPVKSIARPASARPLLCTFCGICRTASAMCPEVQRLAAAVWCAARLHQSQSLSGPDL